MYLPEVVAVDGILSAQHFTLWDKQVMEAQPHRYLAMPEIESGKEADAVDNLNAAIPSMNMTSTAQFNAAHSVVPKSISDYWSSR